MRARRNSSSIERNEAIQRLSSAASLHCRSSRVTYPRKNRGGIARIWGTAGIGEPGTAVEAEIPPVTVDVVLSSSRTARWSCRRRRVGAASRIRRRGGSRQQDDGAMPVSRFRAVSADGQLEKSHENYVPGRRSEDGRSRICRKSPSRRSSSCSVPRCGPRPFCTDGVRPPPGSGNSSGGADKGREGGAFKGKS